MIDQTKIQAKINELNAESVALDKLLHPNQGLLPSLNLEQPISIWDEIEGTLSLMLVDYHDPSKANFYQNSGVIVKGFINTKTKEIKLFPVSEFVIYPRSSVFGK